jgi:hypothetical protein
MQYPVVCEDLPKSSCSSAEAKGQGNHKTRPASSIHPQLNSARLALMLCGCDCDEPGVLASHRTSSSNDHPAAKITASLNQGMVTMLITLERRSKICLEYPCPPSPALDALMQPWAR